jgi:Tfp pilus assembly protein PilX
MRDVREQGGAAMLMVIGVVAALAVLASALVVLTVNAQSNTAHDRDRAKAFNVAEAAVDVALSKLGRDWPLTSAVYFTQADKDAFLPPRFPASEFANPTVSVTYFDNQNTDSLEGITVEDGIPADTYSMDANGDGLIYIEAQASVGGKKARIQLEAKRNVLDTKIPRGVVAGGDTDIDGNNNKSSIGCDPSEGGYMADDQLTLQILVGGTIYPPATDPAIIPPENQHSGLGTGVVDSILTPEVLQGLIAAAQTQGTWYSDIASEQALGAKPLVNHTLSDANVVGAPVVVETSQYLRLAGNGVFNGDGVGTNAPPGILIVIGPHTMYPDDITKTGVSQGIDLAGVGTYYGIVYTDGGLWGTGTINIVGMALAKGTINLTGERRIDYNDNVVVNLNKTVLLSAQIVPNTWRQIHPL